MLWWWWSVGLCVWVQVPSEKSAFRLVAVDLFDLAQPIDNIAAHPNNRVQVGRWTSRQ